MDFKETFSPVVRYDSVRVLLATVTHEDLEMVQFDVCKEISKKKFLWA